jgi:hypothetical protein
MAQPIRFSLKAVSNKKAPRPSQTQIITPNVAENTAGARIIETFKLCETILLNLPLRDLLRAQTLCRHVHFTTRKSGPLNRKLFLIESDYFDEGTTITIACGEDETQVALNPLLLQKMNPTVSLNRIKLFSSVPAGHANDTPLTFTDGTLPFRAKNMPQISWMLVSQPPATAISIYIPKRETRLTSSTLPPWKVVEVHNEKGISIGELSRATRNGLRESEYVFHMRMGTLNTAPPEVCMYIGDVMVMGGKEETKDE